MGQKSREAGSGEKTVDVLRNSWLFVIKVLSVHLLHPNQSAGLGPCAVNRDRLSRGQLDGSGHLLLSGMNQSSPKMSASAQTIFY